MKDDFDTRVAAWLQDRARPDPIALAAVVASIDALPARRVAPRRGWLLVAAAVVAIAAIGATSLLVATRPHSSPPVGPSHPVAPDPAAFAGDQRLARCLGTAAPVEFVFEMAHARDYQRHLPAMLLAPELDVDDPALVVVFATGARLPVGGRGAPSSLGPNERSVCILVADAPNLYEGVDISGMQPITSPQPRGDGRPVLVWQIGSNGLGLVAFEERFPPDALIALAESAQAPGP